MIPDFRFIATSIMFLISLSGFGLNALVISRMRREKEGFHLICVNKAVANVLIVIAYIIWAVPCSYLNGFWLPEYFNVFFGQVIGWGPYLMSGPFTQICLAVNRAVAISYSQSFDRPHRLPYTKLALCVLWIVAILLSLPSMIDGCSYLFYPEAISWGPMETQCSQNLSKIFTSSVMTLALLSFAINIANLLKILKMGTAMGTAVGHEVSATRRRRRKKMFAQCIIQDCTHTLDCVFNNYIYALYDAQWFQFLCGAVSGLFIIVLDGLLMSILHQKLNGSSKARSRAVSTTVITAPSM